MLIINLIYFLLFFFAQNCAPANNSSFCLGANLCLCVCVCVCTALLSSQSLFLGRLIIIAKRVVFKSSSIRCSLSLSLLLAAAAHYELFEFKRLTSLLVGEREKKREMAVSCKKVLSGMSIEWAAAAAAAASPVLYFLHTLTKTAHVRRFCWFTFFPSLLFISALSISVVLCSTILLSFRSSSSSHNFNYCRLAVIILYVLLITALSCCCLLNSDRHDAVS